MKAAPQPLRWSRPIAELHQYIEYAVPVQTLRSISHTSTTARLSRARISYKLGHQIRICVASSYRLARIHSEVRHGRCTVKIRSSGPPCIPLYLSVTVGLVRSGNRPFRCLEPLAFRYKSQMASSPARASATCSFTQELSFNAADLFRAFFA